jgi:hypothetical protein
LPLSGTLPGISGYDVLERFEVIWVFDRSIEPPKPKMIVCLSYEKGWFMRINSSARFRPCVPISVVMNPWLDHDSHVECVLLEFDEYEIEESMKNRRNPVGHLHKDYAKAILQALVREPYIRTADKISLGHLLSD